MTKYKEIIGGHKYLICLAGTAVFIGLIALFGWRWLSLLGGELPPTAHAQSALLEQRLNQVEQRFNYIESRLNRLESESRYPGVMPNTSSRSNTELSLMRTQLDSMRTDIDSLRSRTGELECAVLKLDERTLTPAARATRKPGGTSEPCRTNTGTPVRLSARP
jgi:hypothetical protein